MDDFSKQLSKLEKELRDLKTFKHICPNIRYYEATFSPKNAVKPIVVTFAEGAQPLMTTYFTDAALMAAPPVGNTQTLSYGGQAAVPIYIGANRKILSVEQEELPEG